MLALVMARDLAVLRRAQDLGLAFQLTNICRDVLEDARRPFTCRARPSSATRRRDAAGGRRPAQAAGVHAAACELLARAETFYDSSRVGLRDLPGVRRSRWPQPAASIARSAAACAAVVLPRCRSARAARDVRPGCCCAASASRPGVAGVQQPLRPARPMLWTRDLSARHLPSVRRAPSGAARVDSAAHCRQRDSRASARPRASRGAARRAEVGGPEGSEAPRRAARAPRDAGGAPAAVARGSRSAAPSASGGAIRPSGTVRRAGRRS